MNAGALSDGSPKGNGSRKDDAADRVDAANKDRATGKHAATPSPRTDAASSRTPSPVKKTSGPVKKTSGPVKSAGVVPNKASEDDPRAWGDSGSDNDHDAWLKEQKPPHWG